MELRQLRYFVVLAEELHFGRAAKRLFISQPSLSQQLRVLERNLGTVLVNRDRQRVELTSAGQVLLRHARRTLRAADDARAAVRASSLGPDTILRVGIYATVPLELVTSTLSSFQRAYPAVSLRTMDLNFDNFQAALLRDRVDVAFVRPPVDDPRLRVEPLIAEPRVVCTSRRGELADAGELTVAEVLQAPVIAPPPQAPTSWVDFWQLNSWRNDVEPQWAGSAVSGMSELLMQVALTDGLITTSASAARQFPHPDVTYVPLREQECQVGLAVRHGAPDLRHELFTDHVRSITAAYAADLVPGARVVGPDDGVSAAPVGA